MADDGRRAGARQRLGDRGRDLGQHLEGLDRQTGLVVELERLGQQAPRLGLGLALGLDGLGLGETDLAPLDRLGLGLGDALGLDGLGGLLAALAVGRRVFCSIVVADRRRPSRGRWR